MGVRFLSRRLPRGLPISPEDENFLTAAERHAFLVTMAEDEKGLLFLQDIPHAWAVDLPPELLILDSWLFSDDCPEPAAWKLAKEIGRRLTERGFPRVFAGRRIGAGGRHTVVSSCP